MAWFAYAGLAVGALLGVPLATLFEVWLKGTGGKGTGGPFLEMLLFIGAVIVACAFPLFNLAREGLESDDGYLKLGGHSSAFAPGLS